MNREYHFHKIHSVILDYPYIRLIGKSGPKFADGKTELGSDLVSPPMVAIKQDCIDKCNKIKECNNIEFQPKQNKCYLRTNIISASAPQRDPIKDSDDDGYTIFKNLTPGLNSKNLIRRNYVTITLLPSFFIFSIFLTF